MTTRYFRLLAFLVFIGLEVLPQNSLADGALAIGRDGQRMWYGLARNALNRTDAEAAAMQQCTAQGGGCSIATRFANKCFALALRIGTTNGYAWAFRDSAQEAESVALSNCSKTNRSCEIKESFCDGRLAQQTGMPAASKIPAQTPATTPGRAAEQQQLLRPGEAFVTRFSGVKSVPGPGGQGTYAIDTGGIVGSIIDLRSPQRAPRGEHWIDESQRKFITAAEVGQVFGVVFDDAAPPNIYLTATSAFGLHLRPGTREWMPGMWGPNGGPGTIYRLDSRAGYRPQVFTNITSAGRQNSGAALGNIAFDRFNKQLFVSDLETGMIHRIRASDGADLGFYDHGLQGRAEFVDAESKQLRKLQPIAFNPATNARIADCPTGKFEQSPECWNIAASGRRVWGVGVGRDPLKNEVRLYYAVWSSPAFGQTNWSTASEEEKRNSIWSVGLARDGSFDLANVRREFFLPDFFVRPEDINRAGYSQPVSDITFAECGARPVMLLAERGGIRNLGLAFENPFASPNEARALRYELDQAGVWHPVGRYDVGFYDRKNEGQPFVRANCAGGIAFGAGYNTDSWTVDLSKQDQFIWITGDYLCSPNGPCRLPGPEQQPVVNQPSVSGQPATQPAAAVSNEQQQADDSEVHGVQGIVADVFDQLVPAAALGAYPADGNSPYPTSSLDQSYLIDTDINVDASSTPIEEELTRNDATKIGDIAVYQICVPQPQSQPLAQYLLPPPPNTIPVLVGHSADLTHALVASHGTAMSHYRFGSHNPYWSHSRFASHNSIWSHSQFGSHNVYWSHNRFGSHSRAMSHSQTGSHNRVLSHYRTASHNTRLSHSRRGSHTVAMSRQVGPGPTPPPPGPIKIHTVAMSGQVGPGPTPPRPHDLTQSHSQRGSHTVAMSRPVPGPTPPTPGPIKIHTIADSSHKPSPPPPPPPPPKPPIHIDPTPPIHIDPTPHVRIDKRTPRPAQIYRQPQKTTPTRVSRPTRVIRPTRPSVRPTHVFRPTHVSKVRISRPVSRRRRH